MPAKKPTENTTSSTTTTLSSARVLEICSECLHTDMSKPWSIKSVLCSANNDFTENRQMSSRTKIHVTEEVQVYWEQILDEIKAEAKREANEDEIYMAKQRVMNWIVSIIPVSVRVPYDPWWVPNFQEFMSGIERVKVSV